MQDTLFDKLQDIAYELKKIGMIQTAGDYYYLIAWLLSPEWNDGAHLKPDPAGDDTIDEYSQNCPIPYTANYRMIVECYDNDLADIYLNRAKEVIIDLSEMYTSEEEQVAFQSYIEYTDKLIEIIEDSFKDIDDELLDGVDLSKRKLSSTKFAGIDGWLNKDHINCVLSQNTNNILYNDDGSKISYTEKQIVTILAAYNESDELMPTCFIDAICYHNGSSWNIAVSTNTNIAPIAVNRVIFTVEPDLSAWGSFDAAASLINI